MRLPSGLRIDNPAWPLLQALVSYWGITDNNGNAAGTTIRCGALALEPSYANHALKILSGPAAGQTRDTTLHPAGTDTVTVANAFSNVAGAAQQITAGILFVILSKTPAISGYAELANTGATTGAPYIDALDIDARLYNEFTIKINNTDLANSLDYRVLLRPEHGVADQMIQPEDITLAPADYDFVNIDHKWGQVIVQVRDTVPASNADFSVYVICNKQ